MAKTQASGTAKAKKSQASEKKATQPAAVIQKVIAVPASIKPGERINLQAESGMARFKELVAYKNAELLTAYYDQYCDLDRYLKTLEQSPLKCGESSIYAFEGGTAVLKGRRVSAFSEVPDVLDFRDIRDHADRTVSAVIISDCKTRHGETKNLRVILLLNADEDTFESEYTSMVTWFGEDGHPSVSFNCLGEMFKDADQAVQFLANGRLVLLDYTPEERIEYSAAEKRTIKANNSKPHNKRKILTAPKLGFSQMESGWHRASTCLFKDTKTGTCYIFGQDEDSYFGCELPAEASTIEAAYKVLTPKEVQGKEYMRQGEWFAVKVPESEVPEMKDCVVQFGEERRYGGEGDAYLPLETEESNRHSLTVKNGRVSKSGMVYVKDGELQHDQHAHLQFADDQWYTFYRNTAVRSVSQEGVD